MLKFARNTHFPNGIYRGAAAFQPLAQSYVGEHDVAGFVHMLASEPRTLAEVLTNARHYNAQYPDAPFCADPAQVALILLRLCEAGLARAIWALDETEATRAQKARVCAEVLQHQASAIEQTAVDGQASLIRSLADAATYRELAL